MNVPFLANIEATRRRRGRVMASAQSQEVVHGEAGVLQHANRKAATDVARMHRHSDGEPPGFIPQGQMAAALSVLNEALRLQKADQITGGDLRQASHAGMPMESSST